MPNEVSRGLKAGFYKYLTKPVDLAVFAAALSEVIPQKPSAGTQRQRSGTQAAREAVSNAAPRGA
jgi:hypothetical protein